MGYIAGIDLNGSRNSMAVSGEDGRPWSFSYAQTERTMGSPDAVIGSFESRVNAVTGPLESGDDPVTLLGDMKSQAEATLRAPIEGAVITVPTHAGYPFRMGVRHAASIAGMNVLLILNRTTATALALHVTREARGRVLVCDLIDGVLDVSVIEVDSFGIDVLATGSAAVHGACGGIHMVGFMEGVLDEASCTWADIDHLVLLGGSAWPPEVRDYVREATGLDPEASAGIDVLAVVGAAVQAVTEAGESLRLFAFSINPPTPSWNFPEPVLPISDVASCSLGIVFLDPDGNELEETLIPRNSKLPEGGVIDCETVVESQRSFEVRLVERSGSGGGNEACTAGDAATPWGLFPPDVASAPVVRGAPHPVVGIRRIPLPPGLPKGSPLRIICRYDREQLIHISVIDLTSGRSLGDFDPWPVRG